VYKGEFFGKTDLPIDDSAMPSTSGDGIVVDAYKETESSIVLGLV
jgi:hypothetical protein